MRTYRGWLPGAVADRPAYHGASGDHSEHERKARAEAFEAVEVRMETSAREEIDRLQDELGRIADLMRSIGRRQDRKKSRRLLQARRSQARDEIGSLQKLIASHDPSPCELPPFIKRHGNGYRVEMTRRVYETTYVQCSQTHMTVAAASAAIGAVRRKLEKITKAARRKAEAAARESA